MADVLENHGFEKLSAVEQGRLIAAGDLTSRQLVDHYLARIAARDEQLSSFTYVSKRRSRSTANRPPASTSSLRGVPTAIKDLNLVRGMPARMGSRAYRHFIAPIDDPVARSIRAAGLPILGKLSASELGHAPVTEPLIHPPTRNPHALDRSSGGSSGGSGAAVAAGLVPVAHGSDGAGSIRIPAAFCGLVGFKPSRDMVVSMPRKVDSYALTVNGPLARCVADAVALLQVLALPDKRSAFTGTAPIPKKLRVAVSYANPLTAVDPEHARETKRVADWFTANGHEVVEMPWFQGTLDEFLPVWRRFVFRLPVFLPKLLMPTTKWLRDAGRDLDTQVVGAIKLGLEKRVDQWFSDFDVWISPTVPRSPPHVGETKGMTPEATFRHLADFGVFTAVFNISGQPAISLPMHKHSNGCPIGVQLAARRGADDLLLSLSAALEREAIFPSALKPV